MNRTTSRPPRRRSRLGAAAGMGAAVSLAATLLTGPGASAAPSAITDTNKVGIVCTTDDTNPGVSSFILTTRTGYISLPDGNTAFMWGYSEGTGGFQHPGPVLCVNQGDTVNITLTNSFAENVSIMFPGQENVTVAGSPVAPEFGVGNELTSLTNSVAPNNSITYTFTADKAGTFLYQSGTNPDKQVRMGLFGALIVHPSLGSDFAYDDAESQFTPEEEFLVLLSEIDPYQHELVRRGRTFQSDRYHPRYWLVNGRGFPDSIANNGASWLPNQPYGALATIHEFNDQVLSTDPQYHPYPGLARYLNVGSEDFPMHPHGNNGLVVARDGEPYKDATSGNSEDLSFEKFSINIGPGQTWDVLFKWYDENGYDPDTNPVPVVIPQALNQEIGVFYSGSPYLGSQEDLPTGTPTGFNQCGEYYIINHNHALHQITSWGANMTGPITYMRILPPEPNGCGD